MLTVAYCRVSTEEQAAEGFSIEGQGDKLRAYADLHDLGPVTVIQDPGVSGKSLDRPGLQQVLGMIDRGHVAHLLVWRLDRLSRNLGDLILLAERFGKAGVGLHSFTERLDLSSATGRMFYNVLGSFAQFYREQLAENVSMGMARAAREGKWTNRPKTGYDLIDGELVPNGHADTVRRIFELRASGHSYADIERLSGVNYSTAHGILDSRIYLGEVVFRGEWFPGRHEAIVTSELFARAHRGWVPEKKRLGRHPLSGVVRCGLCGKVAATEHNGKGSRFYRCWNRGRGCDQPSRSVRGIERAAVLGLRLVGFDQDLQRAIRQELRRGAPPGAPKGRRRGPAQQAERLRERRRKLLDLHYAGKITADLFAEEEASLAARLRQLETEQTPPPASSEPTIEAFEAVAKLLADLNIEEIWQEATDDERRILVNDLLDGVWFFPDHLEVRVTGAPKMNVTLQEVGLTGGSSSQGVGEPTRTPTPPSAAPGKESPRGSTPPR